MSYHHVLITSLTALLLSSVACTHQVIDQAGLGNGQGSLAGLKGQGGSDGGGTTPGTGTKPNTSRAIIYRYGDTPKTPTAESGTTVASSSSSGGGVDPDRLVIAISDESLACGEPTSNFDCGNHFTTKITLPAGPLQPGIYSLADEALITFMSVTGPDEGHLGCWAGGGSFMDGTLEIVSVSDSEVVIVLEDTIDWDFDVNGVHHVLRCPSGE